MVDSRFYKNQGPFSLAQVAEICGAELLDASQAEVKINELADLTAAGKGDICFFFDKKKKAEGAKIKATACVTSPELKDFIAPEVIVLVSSNPHLSFAKLNRAMYVEILPTAEIKPTAVISPSASIGKNCFIGDNVVIADNVKIGDNCYIEPNVFIDTGCEIGSNNHIGALASIKHCIMGNNCFIYGGVRIGWDGFGFMTIQGQHQRIPQLGRVIIGNNVEIGANSCVDRGALSDTVIGDGCMLDNLVMIAHNVKLGRGCVIVSQVGIAGSTELDDYVVCGGQVGIAGHLHIGMGSQIAAQSGVMRDLPPQSTVMGCPSVPMREFMRQAAYLQKISKK